MEKYYCRINITSEEVKKYYLGTGYTTRIVDTNGLKIDLPTRLLIPHMTTNGIHGDFYITSSNGKSAVIRLE
jgi:hypothetical protein